MAIYFGNSFSLAMLGDQKISNLSIKILSIDEVKAIINSDTNIESCIGHVDTASVVSHLLGVEIPYNRCSVTLKEDDSIIVAQLLGGRLPEGATTLPENYSFRFILVRNNGDTNAYCRETLSGLNTSMDGFALLFSAIAIEDKIKI